MKFSGASKTSLAFCFLLSLFLTLAPSAKAGPQDSDFWQSDKQKHFALVGGVSTATYITLRSLDYGRWESLVTSVALGVLIGTAKEVYDHQADSDDIKADAAGGIVGAGFCFTVDVLFF